MMLLGSETVPVLLDWVPKTVNASEGIDPRVLSEADEGPEFSSQ